MPHHSQEKAMEPNTNKIEPPLANAIAQNSPRRPKLNRLSSIIMTALSLTALLMVLSGYIFPAHAHATDEEDAAHIFQLSIAALVPTIIFFVATADWRRPLRTARPLAFTLTILAIAFAALYHLEH
jgi:energy-coupling factor transporter transmembrane protein EcfT